MEPSNRPIRVLVADDSPTALRSLCKYLEFQGTFEIIGKAYDGQHLLDQTQRLRHDLVLPDLSMPKLSGLEAAKKLRDSFPELRVLIFSELSGIRDREYPQKRIRVTK